LERSKYIKEGGKAMITLKRIRGKLIVKVDANEIVFSKIWDAVEFIYSIHSRRARASL
jgi:hypothetical protein